MSQVLAPHSSGNNRFFEPFLGGGAVFFDLLPDNAILSDLNRDLMHFYASLAEWPDEMFRHIEKLAFLSGLENYLEVRTRYPHVEDPVERAALFFYLNRCGFNGIWRVNSKGDFNVPYGNRRLVPPKKAAWDSISSVLRSATLRTADFRSTLAEATSGDLVFLDPPYIRAAGGELFARYTVGGFSLTDHQDLSQCVKELDARGCWFVLTTSEEPAVQNLYTGFSLYHANNVHMAGGQETRASVREMIITNISPMVRAVTR